MVIGLTLKLGATDVRRFTIVLMLASAIAASACSTPESEKQGANSTGPGQANTNTQESSPPNTGDTSGNVQESEFTGEHLVIPEDIDVDLVMRYMGLDWSQGNLETIYAEDEDLHREREDSIFECMRDHGFEYTRQPLDDMLGQLLSESEEHGEIGSRTWHQWYGRGISTLLFPQEILPSDLAGYSSEQAVERPLAHDSDLSSLTIGEQQAYRQALFGDDETEGCSTQAWNQANSDFGLMVRTWAELLVEVEERVWASEPMVEYETSLIECIRGKGYPEYTGFDDQLDEIHAQMQILVDGEGHDDLLSEEAIETLRLIQQRERDISVAEFDCRAPQDEQIAMFRNAVEAVLEEYR